MNIKSALSIAALCSALALSGPVYAQTVINGVEVPEAELAAVQARCDELSTAESTEALGTTEEDDDGGEAEEEVTADTTPTATIDLETLTLEACIEAGLVSE
jgi:hypothetical protein